jgi:hypothetical protein
MITETGFAARMAPLNDAARPPADAAKAALEFEAAMLTPLVEILLPQQATEGSAQAGAEAWHGMMAQAVALQLATQGGLGLQSLTAAALEAKTRISALELNQ